MLWNKSLLPSLLLLLLLFLFLLLLHLCPAQRGKNLGSCNFWISKYIWEVVSLFWILIYNMCIFVMVVTYYKWQHEWSASVGELHAKKICHFKSIGQLLLQFPEKILMQIYWKCILLRYLITSCLSLIAEIPPSGLLPDDLRWSWCNNNRNKVQNKMQCTWIILKPSPPKSMEKLSSTKPVRATLRIAL